MVIADNTYNPNTYKAQVVQDKEWGFLLSKQANKAIARQKQTQRTMVQFVRWLNLETEQSVSLLKKKSA